MAPKLLVSRRYDDDKVAISFEIDADHNTTVVVRGDGTLGGARAMLGYLDDAVRELGPTFHSRVFFDLSESRGAPLRAQFMFGKWLLGHKAMIARGVVVGARPLERRIAAAAVRIAGLSNVRFFERADEARAWLHGD